MYEVWGTLGTSKRAQLIAKHDTESEAITEAEYQLSQLSSLSRLEILSPEGSRVFDTRDEKSANTLPKLTSLEREILNHRLDVPDALADVFDGTYAREDVQWVAHHLRRGDLNEAVKINPEIALDVLADAVEGSTFLAAASEESHQKQTAIWNAGDSLAQKIGKFLGRNIYFPNY